MASNRLASASRRADVRAADAVFALVFAAALALVGSMLVLAVPLGNLVFPAGGFRFLPSVLHLVFHKQAEEARYLLAVVFALGVALAVAGARSPAALANTQAKRMVIWAAGMGGRAVIAAVAVWGWVAQFGLPDQSPTTHFNGANLVVAVVVGAALVVLARRRPHWLDPHGLPARSRERRLCVGVAALLTVCWLLPSLFREQNLAAASLSVTYHLQFTFDDFVAVVNGRTPLVNYAEQYSSLLPFVVWPALSLGGSQIGVFTAAMCLLSGVGLLAVQRTLAMVIRNERLALVLYVPFLAASLFFVIREGSQLFSWASYYGVFPMRYFGPYVLLWLCVRHLRGMRPARMPVVLCFAGLVLLNNLEFGLPAFAAGVAAMLAGGGPTRSVRRVVAGAALGLTGALIVVSTLTLWRAGRLPDLGLLTLFARTFAAGGLALLHTPVAGFHLIVYLTFAAAVVVAGARHRVGAEDHVYTAALAFCGVFGLGTGGYFMGRTSSAGLVALFSIWSLNIVLLGSLALRSVVGQRHPIWGRPPRLLVAGALVSLGLATTAVSQFPPPWTQIQRLATTAPPPVPYNVSAAVDFLRRTAAPGEHVVIVAPVGHLIASDARVDDVSPYNNPDVIVTYQAVDDLLAALHDAGGTRFYTAYSVFPEIIHALERDGFSPMTDPASQFTLWHREQP